MNNLASITDKDRQWCIGRLLMAVLGVSFLSMATLALVLGLLFAMAVSPPRLAQAQGSSNGVITHTTVTDFAAGCSILTNTSVSSTSNGEIRLTASLEDYFDDSLVDSARWQTGFVYTWYTVSPPTETGGMLVLDGSYMRSQVSFTQSPRFFEANAQLRVNVITESAWSDLGFYRQMPPFSYTDGITEDSAIRLFIAGNDATGLYVRTRENFPASPTVDANITDPDLTGFHNFRIEWAESETRYYVDNSLAETVFSGTSSLPAWVFLYSQEPGRQINIDWIRAGQYALSGSYVSCTQDAGQVANWTTLAADADQASGTTIVYSTRTSIDGNTWSDWLPVSGNNINSPSGRYLQYRIELATGNTLRSPEVQKVSLSYFGPSTLVMTPTLAVLNPGANRQFTAQIYDDNDEPVEGLVYTWQVLNGGGTINSNGLFTGILTAGTYTDTVQVGSNAGLTQTASVIINNLAPTAAVGGPYMGLEGQAVNLNGSGSSDPNNDSLSYAWDLDDDDQFDDASIASPAYTWPDNGVFSVTLLITDSGGLTSTVATTASIANVAPIISGVANSGPVSSGKAVTVTVTATDPGADILTYSFDWNNDGSYEIANQLNHIASTVYTDSGDYIVKVRVLDGDQGQTIGSTTIKVDNFPVYLPILIK